MKITTGLVVGFLVMLTAMSPNVSGQQDSNVRQPLIVGTKEAPPFSMKAADGQWTGLSIDLWRQIAAEFKIREKAWQDKLIQYLGE